MQLVVSGYRTLFSILPRPLRIVLNTCMLPIIVPVTVFRIVVDHFKYPEPFLNISQEQLDAQLSVEVDAQALDPLHQVEAHCYELSQQGRWDDLARMMASFDKRRATFGTTRLANVAAAGARGGHLQEMQDFEDCSLMEASDIDDSELLRLQLAFQGRRQDPYMACILARAHLDMAWALRGGDFADEVTAAGWDGYAKHVALAAKTMAPFDAIALDSALVAGTKHLIAPNLDDAAPVLKQTFETYTKLDPLNWDLMGQYAFHLLPRWYGDYTQIEVAARTAIAASEDVAGTAAYAAFYMGILHRDEDAIRMVDPELFEQSLRDMIDHGGRDPIEVNRIIGYCLGTFADSFGAFGQKADPEVIEIRTQLRELPYRLIRDYFDCHLPQVLEFGPAEMRQIVGLAYESELDAGAVISISTAGTSIDMPPKNTEA